MTNSGWRSRGHLRPLAGFDLTGGDDGLGAAFDAELLQDGGDMRLDGRLRHAELVGDLFVEEAAGEHHQHSHLLRRQRGQPRDDRGAFGVAVSL